MSAEMGTEMGTDLGSAVSGSSAPPTRVGRIAFDDDAKQLLVVLVFAAVALLLGWGLKTWTENQTRTVTVSGVSAAVPSGWVTTPGAGDVLFRAFDPSAPAQRYTVAKPSGETSPAQALDRQMAAAGAVLNDFQVIDRGVTTVNGAPAETATYTYVRTQPGQVPVVIQGQQLAIASSDGGVILINLESPARTFDNALPAFESFAASVKG
jgi:hypothetical protein